MRAEAARYQLPIQVASAGLLDGGRPVHPRVVARVKHLDSHVEGRQSKGLTDELVAGADIILTMTADHALQIVSRYPDAMPRVHAMRHFIRVAKQRAAGQDILQWVREANRTIQFNYAEAPDDLNIADPIDQPAEAFDVLLVDMFSLTGWLRRHIVADIDLRENQPQKGR